MGVPVSLAARVKDTLLRVWGGVVCSHKMVLLAMSVAISVVAQNKAELLM